MRVFACGRLIVAPRRSAERALKRAGGTLVKRMQDAELAFIGGGAVAWPAEKLTATIENAERLQVPLLSERGFLRRIGMLPPLAEEARPYARDDLSRRAGIPPELLHRLVLFDIIEGEDGRFGFRAMKAAKAAAALVDKVSLADLAAACHRVRSAFNVAEPLSELQLAAENKRIVLSAGGRLADLDGQLRLELYLPGPDVEALLGGADEAREAGRDEEAERQLRQALAVSPKDTDVLFELGSLLCEREQFAEGVALLQKATRLRPDFADAWYNVGHAFERQGHADQARQAYSRAAEADPFYADPLYNLGMLCLEDGRYAEAIDRLEGYLALDSRSGWSDTARKAVTLARMSMTHAAAG